MKELWRYSSWYSGIFIKFCYVFIYYRLVIYLMELWSAKPQVRKNCGERFQDLLWNDPKQPDIYVLYTAKVD